MLGVGAVTCTRFCRAEHSIVRCDVQDRIDRRLHQRLAFENFTSSETDILSESAGDKLNADRDSVGQRDRRRNAR